MNGVSGELRLLKKQKNTYFNMYYNTYFNT